MENAIYQLHSTRNKQMDSYIVTTAGGTVLVIDGGYRWEAENMLTRLRDITSSAHPTVNAWILTHAHDDHISCFNEIMEHQRDALTVERVMYNFPSAQYCAREDAWGCHDPALDDFREILPTFANITETVYGFDVYDIGDLHMEVLYSPNPEIQTNYINNASIIFMLTLGGKKILFPGDAGVEEGERCLALLGADKLKADYVQMAHHGQNGVNRAFYEAVAPTGCLWGTPDWLFDNDVGKGFNTHVWKTVEVRGWMEELGVKEHYIMKDGMHKIKL